MTYMTLHVHCTYPGQTCSAARWRSSSRSHRDWDGAGNSEEREIPPADILWFCHSETTNHCSTEERCRFNAERLPGVEEHYVEVGLGGPIAHRLHVHFGVVFQRQTFEHSENQFEDAGL